jgi:hypothetical protein
MSGMCSYGEHEALLFQRWESKKADRIGLLHSRSRRADPPESSSRVNHACQTQECTTEEVTWECS